MIVETRLRRAAALLVIAVAVTLLLVVGWFSYIQVVEAYGSGPPYYGRTTNMDKWTDPMPLLAVVDVLAALAIAGLILVGVRLFRRSISVDREL